MLQNKTRSSKSVVFKQFNRKDYSVFSSLRKEVQIGVLGVATLTFANPGTVSAQKQTQAYSPETANERELSGAKVTAMPSPLAAAQAARIVTTISRDEIARSSAESVNDLLKQAAGVDVRQRGAFGVQTDISIGGGTFDQITILLNGVSLNNPQTGHLSADFPVSLDDIERIEILQGAASRVFGTQAFSGAINIVTRSSKNDELSAHAEGGSYGSARAGASLDLKLNNIKNHISGEFLRSDGGTTNSDFQKEHGFYSGSYSSKDVTASWQGGVSRQSYGANTFYSAAYPNQWEENSRYFLSTGVTGKLGNLVVKPSVSWIRSTDHFQLIKGTGTGENFHRTDVYTVGLSGYTIWSGGRTGFGAEIRGEGILSTNLGKQILEGQEVSISGEKGMYYNHRDNRTNSSYYLSHDIQLQGWMLSAGFLMNRNTAVDELYRFYPGVDISFSPSESWRFSASWNKALRMPTFTDLYYKSPTIEGNVGLKPEETSAIRLGANYSKGGIKASAAASYQRGENMIDWVMYSATDTYHSAGFKLDNYSVEANASLDFPLLIGGSTFIKTFSIGYAYIYQKRKDDVYVYKSNYALEYLRHKFTASLSHRIVGNLSASWNFRWQERMGAYILYSKATSTGQLTPYAPYALLDGKLSWTEKNYTLYLNLNNITAHHYYDLGNIEQPGLWFMAGAKINFTL